MLPYSIRRALLRLAIALPAPDLLLRLLRFYVHTRAGENFGDMALNGEFRFLAHHAPDCRILFDVGAHHGDWSTLALRHAPGAEIHCFEPIASHFERLSARPFAGKVVLNPLGLSDRAGVASIFTDTLSLYERSPADPASAAGRETVHLTTLDRYCESRGIERIDLLKIDAEGHDLAILQGGRRLIEAGGVRRIQFEYGPPNIHARVLLRDLLGYFDGLPYDLYQVMPHGLRPLDGYDTRLENFVYKNFIALQRGIDP